jgi:polyhydroxyalkanoate synthase
MREGPLSAIEVVQEITGETELNLGGFCIGGILSVCTLAWMAAGRTKSPIRSATLLATMVDLREIGETSVFIDEGQLEQIARHAAETGFLESHHLVEMFSMLRENDLIWNYVVNNYLMGRDPMAFDMLYWNADATRLPAAMLLFYLRHLYMENALAERGLIDLEGRPIDVCAVKTPCYMLSTKEDHIAPWTSSYPATQRFAGPMRFVLGESGHIAGVVNPPSKKKYGYWTRKDYPADPAEWLEGAEHKDGSWWPDWARWIAPHGGLKVAARRVGSKAHPPIEDAPGSYVLGK